MTEPSLTNKTLNSLKWSYLSTLVASFLQIGYTAVMARLLEPTDFGLVAMAGVVLRFGNYFAQMGIGAALVQKREISNEDIRAAFTSSLILGLLFSILFYLLAPLSKYLFHNSAIVPVVRVMAFSFVLTGTSITALSLLRRNYKFRSIALIDIFSYLIGYIVIGFTLAFNGYRVWSLVIASLSQSIIVAAFYYIVSKHSRSLLFDWKYYKHLYSFGSRVSIISFSEFISSNLDTLIIGHSLGANSLGLYNKAWSSISTPMYQLTNSLSKVISPSLSQIQFDVKRLRRVYLTSIMLVAGLLIPMCAGVAAASNEIILLLLGEKWIAAVPLLQILVFAITIDFITHFAAITCEATAKLNIKMVIQLIYLFILSILLYSLSRFGLIGFAFGMVIGQLILHSAYLFFIKRMLKIDFNEIIHAYMPGLIFGLVIGPAIYLLASFLNNLNLPIYLIFLAELITGLALTIFLLMSGLQQNLKLEVKRILLNSDTKIPSWLSKLFLA